LWDLLFEKQDKTTNAAIMRELQRVASGDPRVIISDMSIFPQENGILIELEIQFVPNADAQLLSVFFDQQQRMANFA
jgi:hypothetical protein